MKEHAKQWGDKFREYEQAVKEFSHILKFLRYDYELMSKGYRFSFAVDSHDTLKHIFPFKKEESLRFKSESEVESYRRFVREQIALAFVFHGLADSLILLPSHLIEIDFFLEIEKRKTLESALALAAMGFDKYNSMLKATLEQSEFFRGVEQFESVYEMVANLDEKTFLNLAEDYYKDFLALLQLNLRELRSSGSSLLLRLFRIGRLSSPKQVMTGFSINMRDLDDNYPRRKATLLKFQSKGQTARAAINDILALEYIRQMNDYGARGAGKNLVLFIASSMPMLRALEEEGNFGMPDLPEDYNFVRCPEFCLTLLMLRKGVFYEKEGDDSQLDETGYRRRDYRSTIEEIDNTMDTVNLFERAIKTFGEVEKSGIVTEEANNYFKTAANILEKVKGSLNSWENLRLIRNGRLMSSLVTKTSKFSSNALEGLALSLKSLQDPSLADLVEDKLAATLAGVQKATEETRSLINSELINKPNLKQYIPFTENEKEDEDIYLRVKRKDRYLREKEYQINFSNPEITSAVHSLQSLLWQSSTNVSEIKRQLRSLVTVGRGQGEYPLFWATIFVLIGRFQEAKVELERVEVAEEKEDADYYLLRTIVHRLLDENSEAEKVCSKGLSIAPRDSRLNREMGGILKVKWKSAEGQARSDLLKKAEESFRIAIKESKSFLFRLESMASLSVLLIENGTTPSLMTARKIIEEYEILSKEMKEKHARYWWATSILNIIEAEGEKSDRKKVSDLLEKASKSIEAGRTLAPELGWRSLEERIGRVHPPIE